MTLAGFAVFVAAAAAEIAGCWLVYAVVRLGWQAAFLAPAIAFLLLFAWLLTLVDTGGAGRTFAAYGGVYVLSSLVWLRVVEAVPLTGFDVAGGALILTGSAVLLWAARIA